MKSLFSLFYNNIEDIDEYIKKVSVQHANKSEDEFKKIISKLILEHLNKIINHKIKNNEYIKFGSSEKYGKGIYIHLKNKKRFRIGKSDRKVKSRIDKHRKRKELKNCKIIFVSSKYAELLESTVLEYEPKNYICNKRKETANFNKCFEQIHDMVNGKNNRNLLRKTFDMITYVPMKVGLYGLSFVWNV